MSKITLKRIHSTRVISVKLPLSLYEELQAFRQELQAFDNTMILDVNDLVASALKRDLRVAREELESLKQVAMKPPPARQTTLTPAPVSAPADAPPVTGTPVETRREPDGLRDERPLEQATSQGPTRRRSIQDLVGPRT
jgi:hypothetical protein